MSHVITGPQVRAARALIGWTREQLAELAETTARTIARIEDGDTKPRASTALAIQRAFETAGVILLAPGQQVDGGAGVRLKGGPS